MTSYSNHILSSFMLLSAWCRNYKNISICPLFFFLLAGKSSLTHESSAFHHSFFPTLVTQITLSHQELLLFATLFAYSVLVLFLAQILVDQGLEGRPLQGLRYWPLQGL